MGEKLPDMNFTNTQLKTETTQLT